MPVSTNEDKTMKTQISLTSLSAAAMFFVTGVAMHEAARAEFPTVQTTSTLAAKHGKKILGFKGPGGTARAEQCTHGTNDITVCSDCDSDGVCVVTRCVDGRTGLNTECP